MHPKQENLNKLDGSEVQIEILKWKRNALQNSRPFPTNLIYISIFWETELMTL